MNRFSYVLVALIAIGLSIVGCQKDTLVTDVTHNEDPDLTWGQGDSIPIVTDFYFRGKIDSVLYTLQDSINGSYNLVFDSNYLACSDTTSFYAQLTGMYSLGLTNTLEVKFLKCIEDPVSYTHLRAHET